MSDRAPSRPDRAGRRPHDLDRAGWRPHDHAGRRDRLRASLERFGVEALYVTGRANVRYLSGFTGSSGQVVVGVDGDLLITDDRYTERAASEAPDIATAISRAPLEVLFDRTDGRVGFERDHLSFGAAMDLMAAASEHDRETGAVGDAVEDLRIAKEPGELDRLRAACDVTVAAFDELVATLAPGQTEREIAVRLGRLMVDRGADGIAFDLIVASGPNSAIPHHEPTDRALARGDLVKFDIGATVDGYHADMTRMVALGAPPAPLDEVFDVVRRAQAAGVEAAVAGATCASVDAAARSVIDDAGYGDRFLHGVGHGIGLDVHEAPIVSREGSARLAAHTVLTVEPGVYLPGIGGVRIEDTLAVTPDGPPEPLTTAPRDLITL